MDQIQLKKCWEQFQQENRLDERLSRQIALSWYRSRQLGVDSEKIKVGSGASAEKALSRALEKNRSLVRIVQPTLKELGRQFQSQHLCFMLFDAELRLLVIEKSDHAMLEKILERFTTLGECYGEERIGTSAVGLCVKSGHIESISGYEHYCRQFHELFCIAVPIYDPRGDLLAVIGTAGLYEHKSTNLEVVLEITANLVVNHLKMNEVEEQLIRQSKLHSLIVDAASDGMLTVDMEGRITFINRAGKKILHMDDSVIGKLATEVADFEPTILDVLKTKKGYVDREFRIETKQHGTMHFIKTAIPMKDEGGNMIGVLDVFRSIKQVRSMVNLFTGAEAKYTMDDIIGESSGMRAVKRMVRVAGTNEGAVLILGESGTGKEIVAQAIHNYGTRQKGPFIAINCAALPRNLIESELFGYEEGAFTGAVKGGRPGKFEMAHGGTLFFDEIGDMPLEMQAKLLRVLQQKCVVRIGGYREIPVDVRVIAATNQNLVEMVGEKVFREDLYYRMNVINIALPPLRDRENDLEPICAHFLKQLNLVDQMEKRLTEETMMRLKNWHWPGNIRELENVIEFSFCMAEGLEIKPQHLPGRLGQGLKKIESGRAYTLKQAEAEAIKLALEEASWNITKAARLLGIGRNTLYEKMRTYGFGGRG